MKATPIQVSYNGITVEYNQDTNKWDFELRGRQRHADSLVLAKEAIDKPPPKGAKPFERITCSMDHYAERPVAGEVTSIADDSSEDVLVWFCFREVRWEGAAPVLSRIKVRASTLYPHTPKNLNKLREMEAMQNSIDKLTAERRKIQQTLQPLKIKPER